MELEAKTAIWTLWVPFASESIGREGNRCAGRRGGPWLPKETDRPLHNTSTKGYVCNTGDFLGCLLGPTGDVLMVQVLGMKAWIAHQSKNHDQLRCLPRAARPWNE